MVDIEKNIYNDLMDLIRKEADFKIVNKATFEEGSSEAKAVRSYISNLNAEIRKYNYD